jgi:hypothetical protein
VLCDSDKVDKMHWETKRDSLSSAALPTATAASASPAPVGISDMKRFECGHEWPLGTRSCRWCGNQSNHSATHLPPGLRKLLFQNEAVVHGAWLDAVLWQEEDGVHQSMSAKNVPPPSWHHTIIDQNDPMLILDRSILSQQLAERGGDWFVPAHANPLAEIGLALDLDGESDDEDDDAEPEPEPLLDPMPPPEDAPLNFSHEKYYSVRHTIGVSTELMHSQPAVEIQWVC